MLPESYDQTEYVVLQTPRFHRRSRKGKGQSQKLEFVAHPLLFRGRLSKFLDRGELSHIGIVQIRDVCPERRISCAGAPTAILYGSSFPEHQWQQLHGVHMGFRGTLEAVFVLSQQIVRFPRYLNREERSRYRIENTGVLPHSNRG